MEKSKPEEVGREVYRALKQACADGDISLQDVERWIEDRIVEALRIYNRGGVR